MSKFNKCKDCGDRDPASGWVGRSTSLCAECATTRNRKMASRSYGFGARGAGMAAILALAASISVSPFAQPGRRPHEAHVGHLQTFQDVRFGVGCAPYGTPSDCQGPLRDASQRGQREEARLSVQCPAKSLHRRAWPHSHWKRRVRGRPHRAW